MKVAFFSFGILEQGGGFENFLMDTVPGIVKRYPELNITIVTASDRLTAKLQSLLTLYYFRKHEVRNIHRESTKLVLNKLGAVKYQKIDSLKELKEELKHYDVIHTKNELLELSLLFSFGLDNLPPIVTGIHTPVIYPHTQSAQSKIHNFLYSVAYKKMSKKLAAVYVQNDDDYALMRSFGFASITKISQAIEPGDMGRKHSNSNAFRVLFVGRLSEQKGIDILIDCVENLSKTENFANIEFTIAGTGDAQLTGKIGELCGKYTNVSFLGHVAHEKVIELYDWTDVTVIPSRYETLCKVAIETGMAAKIAIVSDIPGPREVIVQGKTGYLIKPDPEAFSNKIRELFEMKRDNIKIFNLIGDKARVHLSELYDPDKACLALSSFLKGVVVSD